MIVWMPYPADVLAGLPEYCRDGQLIWMASVPLICYDIVEFHYPERVLRQFGYRQGIPCFCDTMRAVHQASRRGRSDVDWTQEHAVYIHLWDRRRAMDLSAIEVGVGVDDQYMPWYQRITRRFMVNSTYRPDFCLLGTGVTPQVRRQIWLHMLCRSDFTLRLNNPSVYGDFAQEIFDICRALLRLQTRVQMPIHILPSPQRDPDSIVEPDLVVESDSGDDLDEDDDVYWLAVDSDYPDV